MDLYLRNECKNLLTQLKVSQKSVHDKLHLSKELNIPSKNYTECQNNESLHFGKDITGVVNISKDADTDLKPTYARNKLLSLSKSSTNANKEVLDMNTTYLKDKENHGTLETSGKSDFDLLSRNKPMRDVSMDLRDDVISHSIASTTSVSPTRLKKRQLIDKHTAVETKLNQKELKELEDDRILNFNYSNINVDESDGIKTLTDVGKSISDQSKDNSVKHHDMTIHPSVTFHDQLQDEGNDRRFKNWVKETTVKPKSLLNSTDYYSLSKRGITSRGKTNPTINDDVSMGDPRLLGYDWIAALLDNERNMIDESESFFDEICDFRKAFKNECNNQFYKESPYTLVDREPEPVVEALTEPKVRPFVVNERLFTEPLTSDLIDNETDESEKTSSRKEPSKNNPRFVRVSIPRSTLQTPHRVKPHRRGSFDGSDSCSLMDHCLLGWENTVPSMIPPAKSLSLAADAGTQINSQTTTLAEAERLATMHNQTQWHLSRPTSHSHILPRWRKHYMDTTLNLTLPPSTQPNNANASTTLNQTNTSSGKSNDIKRTTDRILQATYSTMYEMERLRQQRESEKL